MTPNLKHLDPAPDQWTAAEVRHFLNRAGFGATPAGVAHYAAMSRSEAVDSVIEAAMRAPTPEQPDFVPDTPDIYGMMQQARKTGMNEEEQRRRRNQLVGENRRAVKELEQWWISRMITSPGFLREKLALFWHGHFATSAQKVRLASLNFDMYRRLWMYGVARFDQLVLTVAQSPAMLRYLDNIQNKKSQPNENFARELFELFTLGIGNYSEKDIKESARAFTGWMVRDQQFFYNRRQHDGGRKTIFGQSGAFGGEDVIKLIMQHQAMPRYIGGKLWSFFAYEDPEPELVEEISAAFADDNFYIRELMRRFFLSKAFYSERAMMTRIKSPTEFVTHLQGDLLTRWPQERLLTLSMRQMGQELFFPPNVKGWDGGRTWINSNTLLTRVNIANYLVNGILPDYSAERRQIQERVKAAQAGSNGAATASNTMANIMENNMMNDDPQMMNMMEEEETYTPMVQRKVRAPLDLNKLTSSMRETSKLTNPTELVEACVERFLGMEISDEQLHTLIAEVKAVQLRNGDKPVRRADEPAIRSMIHMILSMAEYQLC